MAAVVSRSTRSLEVMKKRHSAIAAGVLYLQFAVFAAAVLWVLFGEGDTKPTDVSSIPGAAELLTVIVALMVASFALGGWLTVRRSVNQVALGAGIVIAVVAIGWNVLAVIFWLLPLPLMWSSYRATA